MDNLWFGVCSRWIRESIHLRVMKRDSLSSCLSGVGDMDFDVDQLFVLIVIAPRELVAVDEWLYEDLLISNSFLCD